ncbi:MAG TPA: hypothetical protein VD886_12805 [Herpetosiphonaceae bacterium]|nr:hypothetical protein [Herpetosiphonaceae bacterium]
MQRWVLLLAALVPLLVGCGESDALPEAMPEDFRLVYAWREGSLPPPYHYEYRITVEPDGAGLIEFWPDYPGPDSPRWTETFAVSAQVRRDLYAKMRTAEVWSAAWKEENPPRVGGSTSALEARANGKAVTIPGDLVDAQAQRLAPVYAAIDQLVPRPQWEKLQAQRQQYEDTYSP